MTVETELTTAEKTRRGELIAEILMLKHDVADLDRYPTTWGTKTALGIFKTVERLVKDGQ